MRQVANALHEEDPKKNTLKRIAILLGVDESTVSRWMSKDRTNLQVQDSSKNSKPRPDARVKIHPSHKPEIAKRVAGGETQEQVAADSRQAQRTCALTDQAQRTFALRDGIQY